MAHKRKTDQKHVEKLRPDQYQQSKKQYYDKLYGITKGHQPSLLDGIKHQYAAEQTHMQKIAQDKHVLGIIRNLLGEIESGKIPTDYVIRNYEGGWGIPINLTRAHDILMEEKRNFESRINIQETQMKKAVEGQCELRSKMKSMQGFEHDQ